MQEIQSENKLNNKGFSLVELLVALAISSIIILMVGALITNGTRFFKAQMTTVNLQNEIQLTTNLVNESLMEATDFYVVQNALGMFIFTGDFEKKTTTAQRLIFIGNANNATYKNRLYVIDRAYFMEENSMKEKYINDSNYNNNKSVIENIVNIGLIFDASDDEKDLDGYCMTNHLSGFSLNLEENCIKKDENGLPITTDTGAVAVQNPIILNLTITLTSDNDTKTDTKVITLRNKLTDFQLLGGTYSAQ